MKHAAIVSACALVFVACGGSTDPVADVDSGAAAWDWLNISRGAGPCPTGQICSWSWKVEPSGAIETSKQGDAGVATMSAADLKALDAILGSTGFQQSMQTGFKCGSPPTDVSESFQLVVQGKDSSQDVTGCVFGMGEANDARKVHDLVTAY